MIQTAEFTHPGKEHDRQPDFDKELVSLLGTMAAKGLLDFAGRDPAVTNKMQTVEARKVDTTVVDGETRPVYKIDSSAETKAPEIVINEPGVIQGEIVAGEGSHK